MAEAEIRDILNGYMQAWTGGDLATLMACYHDDFVLHYFGANALTGTHVGKAAALGVLGEFSRRTARQLLGTPAVLAGADRGVILAREKLGVDAAVVEVDRVLVYTVADGRLRECWVYDADQAMIDRLIGSA